VSVPRPRVVVVGLGNPALGDDAIGIVVVRELMTRLPPEAATVVESPWGGMRFLDLLAGYDAAVIVDAITWKRGPPGTVYHLSPEQALPMVRATTFHDIPIGHALQLGGMLGIPMPTRVVLLAIEAADTTASGHLDPAVAASVPSAVLEVEAQLHVWGVLEHVHA
jgi:hydrogenase maturation protease